MVAFGVAVLTRKWSATVHVGVGGGRTPSRALTSRTHDACLFGAVRLVILPEAGNPSGDRAAIFKRERLSPAVIEIKGICNVVCPGDLKAPLVALCSRDCRCDLCYLIPGVALKVSLLFYAGHLTEASRNGQSRERNGRSTSFKRAEVSPRM